LAISLLCVNDSKCVLRRLCPGTGQHQRSGTCAVPNAQPCRQPSVPCRHDRGSVKQMRNVNTMFCCLDDDLWAPRSMTTDGALTSVQHDTTTANQVTAAGLAGVGRDAWAGASHMREFSSCEALITNRIARRGVGPALPLADDDGAAAGQMPWSIVPKPHCQHSRLGAIGRKRVSGSLLRAHSSEMKARWHTTATRLRWRRKQSGARLHGPLLYLWWSLKSWSRAH
jgi:hypothetical protein